MAALKFFVRLKSQPQNRWSCDALLAHLRQGWKSPYMDWILKIRMELNMVVSPVSPRHVHIVVDNHFHSLLNEKVTALGLPALRRVDRRVMAPHVDESPESQVKSGKCKIGVTVTLVIGINQRLVLEIQCRRKSLLLFTRSDQHTVGDEPVKATKLGTVQL